MRTITTTDVSRLPDLLRLAQEVRETKKPRMLTQNHETLAMLMPVAKIVKRPMKRAKSQMNYEAIRKAAGSLKGLVDEQVMEEIYNNRTVSTRTPLEL